MRNRVRASVIALASIALCAFAAPATSAAFGVASFEAGTCVTASCTYTSIEANHGEAFTQAAGHPQYGITAFELKSEKGLLGKTPEGAIKRLRVDVPAGLAANPEALPKCSRASFEADGCPSASEVGTNQLTVEVAGADTTVTGNVYNLEQPAGLPLEFGIHVSVPALANEHIYLEGHVDWQHDYHEYFQINEISNKIPVLASKLIFNGQAGGDFLTLPSVCSPTTTSYLEVESYEGAIQHAETHTPIGVEHCNKVPFAPSAEVKAETSASDSPDGATTVVRAPQKAGAGEVNTSDIKDAHVTLPEGLTLNPAAAHGLETCTAAQIGISTANPVACPAASKVASVTIETDLPAKSLTGSLYLASPGGGAVTGPPYDVYLDAESVYGVSVRLAGTVEPDPNTGRLTVSFLGNPQLPFSEIVLTANGGPRAPLANPLACATQATQATFVPYSQERPNALSSSPFAASGCASPIPFALTQSTADSSTTAGANTSFTFNLSRAQGQQYLSRVHTVLPAGLVGTIPSVPLCEEPLIAANACKPASLIGGATASVGAGSEPYGFSGPVYLTGPTGGAPYGLYVPIDAVAGPFNLGVVATRVGINVDPHSGRVIVDGALPTIVKGVPLRLRALSVTVNRAKFLRNPTSCAPLSIDSTLTSTMEATQALSSGFQVGNCGALPFKPTLSALSNARFTKQGGASLHVTIAQGAGEANLRSVVAQLPLQLPSRLTTLQKACAEASFAANPAGCRAAQVGTATAVTPVLARPLSGAAYLVSHGGAAFPDLDLVLEGDGVKVILVGNTNIKGGITTSTFASIPDVPVSSFSLDLPMGPNSALAGFGNLCLQPLLMPTTITAQSGAVVKQSNRIAVSGCGVRILSHRVVGHRLVLKVRNLGAGLLKLHGKGLRGLARRLARSSTLTLSLALSRSSLSRLRHHPHRTLSITVRAEFIPARAGALRSGDLASAVFNRPHRRHSRAKKHR